MLRTSTPELPYHSKDFQGITLDEMTLACAMLSVNGFIFNAELPDGRLEGHTLWRSQFHTNHILLPMFLHENHLMFIKCPKMFILCLKKNFDA